MNRMKITKCNIYGGMKMKEFKYVITENKEIKPGEKADWNKNERDHG